jgi:ribose 5-phosphate isomerase A
MNPPISTWFGYTGFHAAGIAHSANYSDQIPWPGECAAGRSEWWALARMMVVSITGTNGLFPEVRHKRINKESRDGYRRVKACADPAPAASFRELEMREPISILVKSPSGGCLDVPNHLPLARSVTLEKSLGLACDAEMMSPTSELDRLKRAAAQAAVTLISNGMIVGLGTGSTASFAVSIIAQRVADGLNVIGIPTSEKIAQQARSEGIPVSTLAEHDHIDVAIDGADEVEIGTLNLIKGRGGALLREKIVATAAERLIIIVDDSKLVDRLGIRASVPIEVVPFGWQATAKSLRTLGAGLTLRLGPDDQPFVSDGGHYILDCAFGVIEDPVHLQQQLDRAVGVVENGLFLGLTSQVIVGSREGVSILHPESNTQINSNALCNDGILRNK